MVTDKEIRARIRRCTTVIWTELQFMGWSQSGKNSLNLNDLP